MLSKEVIQAFINDVNEKQNSVIYQTSMANAQWLKDTLIEVLQYIEELNKGKHSLMQSRKKWKNRYYKERAKRKELIEKLEEDIKILNSEERITPELVHKAVEAVYAQKLLAILKGEKEI